MFDLELSRVSSRSREVADSSQLLVRASSGRLMPSHCYPRVGLDLPFEAWPATVMPLYSILGGRFIAVSSLDEDPLQRRRGQ